LTDPITPARLRDLADKLAPEVNDIFVSEADVQSAAALRAAADYIDRLLELRASDAQMIGDAHGLVRAREALLVQAMEAMHALIRHEDADNTRHSLEPSLENMTARALAAEIGEALKGGGDE
jgi:transketolase C-terminal domain/subunit